MNPILDKINSLVAAGRHILYVDVTQVTDTDYRLCLTLDDWIGDEDLLAGDGGTIEKLSWERMPDSIYSITATADQIGKWMHEVAQAGNAVDVGRFDKPEGLYWLTKPLKWRRAKNNKFKGFANDR